MSTNHRQGNLRLSLVDALGDQIGGRVNLRLRHQVLSEFQVLNNLDGAKRINIANLAGAPQGLYRIDIDPLAYLPTSRFVNIKASGVTDLKVTVAIDPNKVSGVRFPPFAELHEGIRSLLERSDQVLSFEGLAGEALYNALDDLRKANVLNLSMKCAMTPLSNGQTVLPFIERINEIRGDRFFVTAPRALRQEAKHSAVEGLFKAAPDTLHTPPPLFERAGSFKTPDKFGNLQLTFFLKGDDCVVDIDIDPASGVAHLFQVLEHRVKGIETHPFAVRDILIRQQEIDPGYRFMV